MIPYRRWHSQTGLAHSGFARVGLDTERISGFGCHCISSTVSEGNSVDAVAQVNLAESNAVSLPT